MAYSPRDAPSISVARTIAVRELTDVMMPSLSLLPEHTDEGEMTQNRL